MKCKIKKSEISGEITCPPNKSYTHRAVFLAALSTGQSTINNVLYSTDTNATIEACKIFGAEIRTDNNTAALQIVKPITFKETHRIDAKNSGTTMRIAAGIASLSSAKTTLVGDASLQKRPMQHILDALETLGARCTSVNGNAPITVQGKISGGEVTVPGNVSSQFISSLLICAPLTEKGVTINIKGDLVSRPYIETTIAAMQKFGITVDADQRYKRYTVKPQQYKETVFTIPPDYSSVALLLAAAVLVGRQISIRAPNDNLPQGDKAFLDILKELGVEIKTNGDLMTVQNTEMLGGGTFDLSDTPDLLPPLAIMSLKCQEPLKITNVGHARYKETDRIAIVSRELAKLGIKVDERADGMTLERTGSLNGAELNSEKDHRLFMAFCIAAMYIGNCSVTDAESVAVSYPDFVAEMQKIGAKMSVEV